MIIFLNMSLPFLISKHIKLNAGIQMDCSKFCGCALAQKAEFLKLRTDLSVYLAIENELMFFYFTASTFMEKVLLKTSSKQKLSEILLPSTINLDLKGMTKQEIIDELIDILDQAGFLTDRPAVRISVMEREAKLSTGLGHGVAVPHGKTQGVDRLVAAFGIKRDGIHFDAADGQPVKLFFMLVSPQSVSGPHVKALAQIAKFLRTDKNKEKLLNAKTSEEVYTIFASE